nr:PREDICTED: olfactory receptor 11G2-like [Camelus bactrianus]
MKISNTPNTTSNITGFILLGFPGSREGHIFLFVLFSGAYLLTLMGNGSIICAVCWDQRLHTPMYILLANFSFLEICYVTSTVPNMLANFLSDNKVISFSGCFLQFYFFFSLGATESFFLAIMAFDRYLAICRPLHYPTLMTGRLCSNLVVSCWHFLQLIQRTLLPLWTTPAHPVPDSQSGELPSEGIALDLLASFMSDNLSNSCSHLRDKCN